MIINYIIDLHFSCSISCVLKASLGHRSQELPALAQPPHLQLFYLSLQRAFHLTLHCTADDFIGITDTQCALDMCKNVRHNR